MNPILNYFKQKRDAENKRKSGGSGMKVFNPEDLNPNQMSMYMTDSKLDPEAWGLPEDMSTNDRRNAISRAHAEATDKMSQYFGGQPAFLTMQEAVRRQLNGTLDAYLMERAQQTLGSGGQQTPMQGATPDWAAERGWTVDEETGTVYAEDGEVMGYLE
jgi:hypothetical protein